jgi:bacterioferritin-associated ferredoxin
MRLRTIRIPVSCRGETWLRAPMYVCLCNGLTDRDLRPHTLGGRCSVSMVYQACGCRPQCGKCVPFVRQMLREGSEAATLAQIDGAD